MPRLCALILGALLIACAPDDTLHQSGSGQHTITADTLYTNGVVWTGVPGAMDATSVAVQGGRLVYVGDDATRVTARETVDLHGRFLMHGFIDSHVHFFEGGAALASVDLRNASSPTVFAARIADYVASRNDGAWVLQGNWDHTLWGGELPDRAWIDEATPNTPVFVMRLDGHMALANSQALALAGIDQSTEAPAGGQIIRDASGRLTGVLKDNAMNAVLAVIPPPSIAQVRNAFALAQTHALSLGITHVHAVTANPTETRMFDDFRGLRDAGLLRLRVSMYSPIEDWSRQAQRAAAAGQGDAWLRDLGVKGFVDGSLGSGTAWFHEDYTDEPGNAGLPLTPVPQLAASMRRSHDAGLKLAIHAIGDQAIDVLIDAMIGIGGPTTAEHRFRIEHFQHPTPNAIQAAAGHGIVLSMQPYHAIDDGRWAEDRLGPARLLTTYAFRRILDADGVLAFGSDWPVAPLSPLEGIYAAVTRRTTDGANPGGWQPQEKISVEEALRAYTASNAWAGFEEDQAGTLESGKRADLVVLSADPREVAPDALQALTVALTIVDGQVMYRAPE